MPVGVLGIATGAARVAGKLFQGVKRRREERVEKAAERLVEAQNRAAKVNTLFTASPVLADPDLKIDRPGLISRFKDLIDPGAGLQAISGAANNLQNVKQVVSPISGAQAIAQQSEDRNKVNPMLLIGGAVLVAILFLMKRR